ncbi:hypothetical protein A0H81_10598 [Grifola frondosa]|uniref:Uncharacterized protein n=1 Tax=Grifola frondosa TaxID=5627 RepID=A0A1C7LZD1_GRIFR|nr:hypothetical protein A0H81_10598 [Grifola frondosa]
MYFTSHWFDICVVCLLLCGAGILKWRNHTSGRLPRNKQRFANYTFSASAQIQPGKITYLEFAAPSPPRGDVRAEPTILRKFNGYAANDQSSPGMSGRGIKFTSHSEVERRGPAVSASAESKPSARQDRPSAHESRPALPAAPGSQSLSPVLQDASFSWPEERFVTPLSVPASPISTRARLRQSATPTQVAASASPPSKSTPPLAVAHPRTTRRSNSISRTSSFTSTGPPLFESRTQANTTIVS